MLYIVAGLCFLWGEGHAPQMRVSVGRCVCVSLCVCGVVVVVVVLMVVVVVVVVTLSKKG